MKGMTENTGAQHAAATPRNTWAFQDMDGYRAAHAIVDVLQAAGVTEIYGQSCPTAIFLAAEKAGIRQIGYRTENAGVAMADGSARISRKIAVVTAQNGPAAALLVAGLAEALKASIPILAIVQEVPRATADKNAFQELEHEKIFSGCTKWIRRINLSARAAEYTSRAIRIATSGRPGPVVLLVSPDVLTEAVAPFEAGFADGDEAFGMFPADRCIPVPAKIENLAGMLMAAKRPLCVAGGGAHHSGAYEALAALQELAGVPMATTNMGKGAIDEDHPLSLGVIGNAMGTRSPAKFFLPYIESADLVVFVGTRTNENGTAGWTLFPSAAAYAQIDIDPEELGRNYPALRLQGDARETLEAVCATLRQRKAAAPAERTETLKKEFQEARLLHQAEIRPYYEVDRDPLRPEQLLHELGRQTGPITWAADASYSSIWLVQYIKCSAPGTRFITPRGIAGLGWGFPMAIGAKLADPAHRVICLTGDGGFAHCWAEMETARRHDTPVTIVVLNNGVLGFQINAEESRFDTHTSVCHFGPIDHVAIARACGCDGQTVRTMAGLREALQSAAASALPFVIDVHIDPKAFPPLTAFESQHLALESRGAASRAGE
ncbi:acetolactate synthase-1/2/3 large subunit [Pollutimonas bauzanensis]|uniref:Acetolactate synthase-1/2/3 large subunit n=2 Tax=Pollutimonas bauzanensis TaxID=658167 RepID=A0A1M5Z9L3_9BURK|nr:acetolactate synthase catalytic subunit [Pollutimonas bauzanensis]SHI20914.1 acetolactate synthase-1/2/3 large subunit [Pollutimonas bauzanensis]